MKTNQKPLILVALLAMLIALFAGVYINTRPGTVDGTKKITVEVTHQDGSSKSFTYETQAEYLGEVLQAEGLVRGEEGVYGFYITEVDGEQAIFESDGAYWALYQGDTYASTGIDQTPIADGDVFSLIYTTG